ncbi:FAD-dependent oxidoreductase [bacterium AH-315-C07]|nr:FAD-dependent oxidoreductase [bacterium AH-315-C07]
MKRRKFIQNIALSAPLAYGLPAILLACKKDELPNTDYEGKVIIIGAGAAGMYAASLLQAKNIDVTILEASDKYGGRVMPLKGFADFDIELGAEEIHGKNSVLYTMAQDENSAIFFGDSNNYITLDGSLSAMKDVITDADIKAAEAFVEDAAVYDGIERTVYGQMQNEGIASRVYHLVNALLANEYGTDYTHMSIKGLAEEDDLWTSGDENYIVTNKTFLKILESQCSNILSKIQLKTPITSINYNTAQIKLADADGNTYTADKVIVSVPISVIKDGDISFSPTLSAAKKDAMEKIGMGAGMKIILKFNLRFWDNNLGSIYGDGYVPEFWYTANNRGNNHVLTAFVMGEKAEYLSGQGDDAVTTVVEELDAMYGNSVATNALIDSHIMDWYKEPYIKGAYSYAAKGDIIAARKEVASSISSKLFFAGEATHYEGHAATLHGALETGFRAAEELLESVK